MRRIKHFIKNNYFYLIAIILGILLFDFSKYVTIFNNIPGDFNSGTVFHRYFQGNEHTWQQLLSKTEYYFTDIILWFKNFNALEFTQNLIIFLNDFLLIFINYFLNIMIYLYFFFYLFISKDVEEYKYTRSALAFIRLISLFKIAKDNIVRFFYYLKKNQLKIFMSFLIVLLLQSFLVKFLIEFGIFMYYYFMSSYNLNLHVILFEMIFASIVFVYINVPLWIIVTLMIYMIWNYAIHRANLKKQKNHDSLKVFAKYDLPSIVIINGEPGVGKNRLETQLILATEENFIEEIEETLNDIEIQNPNVNFAELIERDTYRHMKEFPEHYEYYRFLKRQTSMIISAPYAILDPYYDDLSHLLDFDYLRPSTNEFKAVLERFIIITISEWDKEYNSHYTTKEVGEDGLHIAVSTISHWLQRDFKFFIDYQIITQVPLNLRGNSEMFLNIKDRKYKMPFLLNLFSLPFKALYSIFQRIILNYESYKLKLSKHSMRESKRIRKRKDYTLLYSIFRYSLYGLSKILNYFNKYSYIKFYILITDKDNKELGKVKLNVNCYDEQWRGSRLYDSTFLSKAYETKREFSKSKWDSLAKWSSLTPELSELEKVHSRFIDKAFNLNQEQQGDDLQYDKIKTSF